MALTINESSVSPESVAAGVTRQRLLAANSVKRTKVLLDRMTLAADAGLQLHVATTDLAWFQVLEGSVVLCHATQAQALATTHIVFLPPGFSGTLTTAAGAILLYAEVPNAAQHDPSFSNTPSQLRIVDWTREPVLDSEHDARQRIYVATPGLFGTKAIKGEIIIYPPGTQAANHHHEGAEHFMYVLQGKGTAFANEQPISVRKGDLIYYDEHERHYLHSEGTEDMVFVEFFVPGIYKTIWVPGAPICTWTPTGRSLSGAKPVRDIRKHSSAHVASQRDV